MGPALGRAREKRGITQVEAAKAVGVHSTVMSDWERGQNRVSGEAIPVLLKLYGITSPNALQQFFAEFDSSFDGLYPIDDSQKAARGTHVSEVKQAFEGPPVGGKGESSARQRFTSSEVVFASSTSAQKGRIWVEEFLLGLAERGAPEPFLGDARRFLLNADNYEFDNGRAAGQRSEMDDEQKLRHMKGLATVVQKLLDDRLKQGR